MIGITPAASHLTIFTADVGGGTAKGNGEVCQQQTRAAVGRRWKSWKRWKFHGPSSTSEHFLHPWLPISVSFSPDLRHRWEEELENGSRVEKKAKVLRELGSRVEKMEKLNPISTSWTKFTRQQRNYR
ncbi:hypothetical protein LXL04_027312 [Taraxacum kok-saghyz]